MFPSIVIIKRIVSDIYLRLDYFGFATVYVHPGRKQKQNADAAIINNNTYCNIIIRVPTRLYEKWTSYLFSKYRCEKNSPTRRWSVYKATSRITNYCSTLLSVLQCEDVFTVTRAQYLAITMKIISKSAVLTYIYKRIVLCLKIPDVH